MVSDIRVCLYVSGVAVVPTSRQQIKCVIKIILRIFTKKFLINCIEVYGCCSRVHVYVGWGGGIDAGAPCEHGGLNTILPEKFLFFLQYFVRKENKLNPCPTPWLLRLWMEDAGHNMISLTLCLQGFFRPVVYGVHWISA